MKITVFGATGGIGGHVVRQALEGGHTVTAVVRDGSAFHLEHAALDVRPVPGLTDPDLLRPMLSGSDAAISGVGPRGRNDGPVATVSTRAIIQALAASGVSRFVAVSAAPVGPIPTGEGFLNRRLLMPMISRILKNVYDDLRQMEADLTAGATEWTVVRPPRLTDQPLTGRYRSAVGANVPRGYSIARADVAHLMLSAVTDPATVRQPVGIAY